MAKVSDFRAVFSNDAGKSVLEDLNVFCYGTKGYLDVSKKVTLDSNGNVTQVSQTDPYDIARYEGRREVLMYILRKIREKDLGIIEDFIDGEFNERDY